MECVCAGHARLYCLAYHFFSCGLLDCKLDHFILDLSRDDNHPVKIPKDQIARQDLYPRDFNGTAKVNDFGSNAGILSEAAALLRDAQSKDPEGAGPNKTVTTFSTKKRVPHISS